MSIAQELERLQALRERGAIDEGEYARAKARVIGEQHSGEAGSFLRRLSRSASDRVIGGVCGGLGRHTGLPSWAWRVIFCVATLYAGAGLLFYVLLWIFIPSDVN